MTSQADLGLVKRPRPCTELNFNKNTRRKSQLVYFKIHTGGVKTIYELAITNILVSFKTKLLVTRASEG